MGQTMPFEFECENVAQRVGKDAREEIWRHADRGAKNLGREKMPWSESLESLLLRSGQ